MIKLEEAPLEHAILNIYLGILENRWNHAANNYWAAANEWEMPPKEKLYLKSVSTPWDIHLFGIEEYFC